MLGSLLFLGFFVGSFVWIAGFISRWKTLRIRNGFKDEEN